MRKAHKTNGEGRKGSPKKRRLTEFRGLFPATRPYIGVEATRQRIGQQIGEELERKLRQR